MRITTVAVAISIALFGISLADSAQARIRKNTNIPESSLGLALRALAKEHKLQLLFPSQLVRDLRTAGAVGELTVDEALTKLLSGTALTFQYLDENTITIVPTAAADSADPARIEATRADPASSAAQIPYAMRLAQAQTTSAGENVAVPSGTVLLEELVVTAGRQVTSMAASKSDLAIVETPQSVSMVTREEMEARGVNSLNDALRYLAGVQSEVFGQSNRFDDVIIRGFDAGTESNNVYIDGLRRPNGGGWVNPIFDAFALEQVEVLKGPSAVLYGQVAPGGLVNMVSKRPSAVAQREISVSAQSYDTYQAGVQTSGPIDAEGKFLYSLVAMGRTGDTAVEHVDTSRIYVAPSFTWQPSQDTRVTLLTHYHKDDGGSTFQYLPSIGTLYRHPLGRIARDTNVGEPDWNVFNREQWAVGYDASHRVNDNITITQNARYMHIDTLYRAVVTAAMRDDDGNVIPRIDDQGIMDRRAVEGFGGSDGLAVDTRLSATFVTGSVEHHLLFGVDYLHTDWDFFRNDTDFIPPLNAFNPVYSGATMIPGAFDPSDPTRQEDVTSKQLGLYLQDQLSIGGWRITGSVRHDRAQERGTNIGKPITPIDSRATTYRLGALYLFENGFAPYASYATSFEPISGVDTSGKPFDPTEGEQVEVGVKYQPVGANMLVTLSVYDLRQKNITANDPNQTESDPCYDGCEIQIGEVQVRGIELEAKAQITRGFSVLGAVTVSDTKVLEGYNKGNELDVPKTTASIFLDYTIDTGPFSGLGLGAGARHSSARWSEYENTLRMPSYTVFDAALRYDLGNLFEGGAGFKLYFNVNNIADKFYVASCSTAVSCQYASGRTFSATLRKRW